MKHYLLPLFYMVLGTTPILAQTDASLLQPKVQEFKSDKQGKTIVVPQSYQLILSEGSCPHAVEALQQFLPNKQRKTEFKIILGKKGDEAIKKYAKKIPSHKEGYFIEVNDNSIVIAGADARGTFYGVQTLSQMVRQGDLSICTIQDYPDIAFRGVVEGFYGTPWSHEARMHQIEFYGKNKMNTYIYGPKDDPYHSSPNWRKPYPEKEAAQIHELIEQATRHEVNFVWAIHPGKDIKWTDADRDALIQKFEAMYQLGVRSFAVFFDDISGDGTEPVRQAELLNYIDNHFIQKKHDVSPLVMCPTEYNKSWSNVKGGYLTTLGEKLNPSIHVMWTGDRVIACIDKPTLDWINPLIKRKAYIWWNFPVNDYVRDHLLLGPVYGNAKGIQDDMSGFVSNPMEHAESSKIALYSVADYTWNLDTYDSIPSWKHAIQNLLPQKSAYLETFATHCSDLGPNGHGFRRDESVPLQPMLKALAQDMHHTEAIDSVLRECMRLETACDILLADNENPALIHEMRPWLKQGKLLGEYGQCVLQMVKALDGKDTAFKTYYDRARALQTQMYELDMTENQNPYQPGVKVGSLILLPTLNQVYTQVTSAYNAQYKTHLETKAEYNPYTLTSDVPQLKNQVVRARHQNVNVSPSNEVIKWPAGAMLQIAVDQPVHFEALTMDLGTPGVAPQFTLEVSRDGQEWQVVPLSQAAEKTEITASIPTDTSLKYVRLTHKSGQETQVYFKKFSLKVQK
ncbi:beta-N-acetylglucosaminidase [Phocaeicola fibrisolvens]|uniref:beta-N-acetylglucosaminidase n=1 Tax=Phocaeicola fibrisolvens TaxID=2981793 RepID=UPI000822349C|nr:beta-N-acetylglucosaminidase [Phocaeicola fibrisolvens]MCU6778081.1 beta-N-acetylglucosaminidase domain-containing protein [Phocaeicola fibrisolvens]SCH70834.1 O-GlcNAcase BT_4395 precursor [uncultured Bacteroides sp.]